MRDWPLTREALSLAHELFRTPIGAFVGEDLREKAAFAHLLQSSQALGAVYLIVSNLGKEALNPAYVLVRHMLELAVRLRYLEAHPEVLAELAARLRHLESHPEKIDAARPLKWNVPRLWKMCRDLGMSEHYEQIYRWLSDKTHASADSVFAEFGKVAGDTVVPDWQSAHVLICAIRYYDMVVQINAKIFPDVASNFAELQSAGWKKRWDAMCDAFARHADADSDSQFSPTPL